MIKNYTRLLLAVFFLSSITGFSQTNYLQNASFESWSGNPESPDSWSIANENGISKSTDTTEGNFSLDLDLNNTLVNQTILSTWNTSDIALTPNANHTFTFDYKISTEAGNNLSAYLDIVKDEGSYTIQYIHEFIPLVSDGAWHTYTFDFNTEIEEDYAFELMFRANTSPASSIIVDNLQVLGENTATNTDRDALVALYNATGGDNWTTPWDLNADISTWAGVLLNSENRVISLILDSDNLIGEIPSEIGNLSELYYLRITRNNITGSIPAEIGNLNKLKSLFLFQNELEGNLPSSLGNLSDLENLNLGSNNLQGTIPIELGNLNSIQKIDIGYNQLTGSIPSALSNLTTLIELNFFNNQLTGNIPPELGNLLNLQKLILGSNAITGGIPVEIGNLTELTDLNLLSTELEQTIPSEIGNLSKLRYLRITGSHFTGNIPPEIGNLTQLIEIRLSHCNLSGSIPEEIGNLTNLEQLDISYNNLTGSIPSTIGNLSALTTMRLKENNLTGDLPVEIGNLITLEEIYLDHNEISGSLPSSIGNLNSIKDIWLNYNNFSGVIPTEIGNLAQLERLLIDNNELTGTIPNEISNLLKLTSLGLSYNDITGEIPDGIGALPLLGGFGCDNCNLSGNVPVFSSSDSPNVFLRNNNFVFNNLVNTVENSNNVSFNLSPQENLENVEELNIELGAPINLIIPSASHPNNQYQWRKNGINLTNETNATLTVNSSTVTDIGTYDCVIINSSIPTLKLYRNLVTININGVDGEADDDNDGVKNSNDSCPNTSPGFYVDESGCAASQIDDDNDGIDNTIDICPNTPNGDSVNGFGCSENQLSDNDDDNDGVPNNLDVCENTPIGAVTGATGCSYQDILVPKPDDFTAKATSTSCPDTANGMLTVEFKVNQTHILVITGPNNFSANYTQQNGSTLMVTDLEPGSYNIIANSEIGRLAGAPNVEFSLNIETPEEFISGKTVIDHTAKKASIVVSGSKNYEVLVNDKVYTFEVDNIDNQELSFPLDKGANVISIETDKICQGVFIDNVVISNAILTPNPVADMLRVEGLDIMNNVQVILSNISGVTSLQESRQINNGTLEMNISNLSPGIYMLTIADGDKEINLKFVKK
ncbi:thrombospondin type 3 repeat-containing protein [Maribacter sp. BPC-D8]|uniref:leucine-rich repeat domain-containing protein n=1 Tax=Maribacter sp. BPC-D8 TaxID=3053613 RepID=UPI002B462ED0|nr:T9SS type A sorting domain-containing protein [Maribacter sp. BPC-D8]WRI28189.1 thrombospondin type 3 repeat-containing protein [Maribacter sp. BPC-D8]